MTTTTYTSQIQKFFNLLTIEEERFHNSSELVQLHNGNFLTKSEQLRFFMNTYKEMVDSGDFNDETLDTFTDLYENGEFYNAWSLILGYIDLLELANILTWRDLPKQISIGTNFYRYSNRVFQSTYKKGIQDGFYIGYNEDGSVSKAFSQTMGVRNGITDCYDKNGNLSETSLYNKDEAVCMRFFNAIIK